MTDHYQIYPLGDSALTIEFGKKIDEQINEEVISRFKEWSRSPLPGIKEMVPAYCTLTIYYDPIFWKKRSTQNQTAFDSIKLQVQDRLSIPLTTQAADQRSIKVPVCYDPEYAIDIHRVAGSKRLDIDELISIHCSRSYKVFMLGFLPGFAYMGEVDERIVVPRKPQPVLTQAGSVGIAGKQTGIYPLNSPGGWQIIGRTPLKLFDAEKADPILLQAGDTVQFYPITKSEFIESDQNGRSDK